MIFPKCVLRKIRIVSIWLGHYQFLGAHSLLLGTDNVRGQIFEHIFAPNGDYRSFSHDVTAAMLVYKNRGMAAILVYKANPLGIELYFYANTFFCFIEPIWPLVTWVKTIYCLYSDCLQCLSVKSRAQPMNAAGDWSEEKMRRHWEKVLP